MNSLKKAERIRIPAQDTNSYLYSMYAATKAPRESNVIQRLSWCSSNPDSAPYSETRAAPTQAGFHNVPVFMAWGHCVPLYCEGDALSLAREADMTPHVERNGRSRNTRTAWS